jgi:hypothetical protein
LPKWVKARGNLRSLHAIFEQERTVNPNSKAGRCIEMSFNGSGECLIEIIANVERITTRKYAADKMLKILGKLIKDEYVDFDDFPIGIGDLKNKRYAIPFEGDIFINEEGCYAGETARRDAESIRLDAIEALPTRTSPDFEPADWLDCRGDNFLGFD